MRRVNFLPRAELHKPECSIAKLTLGFLLAQESSTRALREMHHAPTTLYGERSLPGNFKRRPGLFMEFGFLCQTRQPALQFSFSFSSMYAFLEQIV